MGGVALEGLGIAGAARERTLQEMEAIMNEVELEGVHLSKPMPGAERTLEALRGRGLGIGVATRGCHAYAERSMTLTGIGSYVDAYLARDDVSYPKPDPRHLL